MQIVRVPIVEPQSFSADVKILAPLNDHYVDATFFAYIEHSNYWADARLGWFRIIEHGEVVRTTDPVDPTAPVST